MRGPFRSAMAIGFLLLSIFMVLPVEKPALWLLSEWGNLRWPFWAWALIFLGVSMGLFRASRPSSVRWALFAAFMALGLVTVACYLTQGLNGLLAFPVALAACCMSLNLDLKAGGDRL